MTVQTHLYLSFDDNTDVFRVPLSDVQEIIRLDGVFGHLDPAARAVDVRRRTVHLVDVKNWLGVEPAQAEHLVVFENNRRLHALPVRRADREARSPFRDLLLKESVASGKP